jgi:hypothetical protein
MRCVCLPRSLFQSIHTDRLDDAGHACAVDDAARNAVQASHAAAVRFLAWERVGVVTVQIRALIHVIIPANI